MFGLGRPVSSSGSLFCQASLLGRILPSTRSCLTAWSGAVILPPGRLQGMEIVGDQSVAKTEFARVDLCYEFDAYRGREFGDKHARKMGPKKTFSHAAIADATPGSPETHHLKKVSTPAARSRCYSHSFSFGSRESLIYCIMLWDCRPGHCTLWGVISH